MPDEFLEEAQARRRISPVRIAVSLAIVAALLSLSILYHDGVIAVDDVDEVSEKDTLYRVRGRVTEVTTVGFVLSAPTGDVAVMWNATTPTAGGTYVVNGVFNATSGGLDGHAVVRAYFF